MDTMRILEIQGFQGAIGAGPSTARCDASVIGQSWSNAINDRSTCRNRSATGSRRSVGNQEGQMAEIAKLARNMLRSAVPKRAELIRITRIVG